MKCPGKCKESERTTLCRTGRVEESGLFPTVSASPSLRFTWKFGSDEKNHRLENQNNNHLLLVDLDNSMYFSCERFDIMAPFPPYALPWWWSPSKEHEMVDQFLHKCLHFNDMFTPWRVMCYCFYTICYSIGITAEVMVENKLFSSECSPKSDSATNVYHRSAKRYTIWTNKGHFAFFNTGIDGIWVSVSCPESSQLSLQLCLPRFSLCHTFVLKIKKKDVRIRRLLKQPTLALKLALAVSNSNVCSATTLLIFLYLCKSICLFDPSSFFCFDTLLLTASADELESAARFLPRPAPLVGVPFSAVPEAAAADLGGRPRRLTGAVSISALGAAFWLGSTWARWGTLA